MCPKEAGNGAHLGARNGWDRDENIGVQIEHHLPTAATRRDQTTSSIAGGCHRDQWTSLSGCGHSQCDKLGAGPTREVMNIHSGVYPTVGIHGGGRHGVVRVATQRSSQHLCCFNDAPFHVKGFHEYQHPRSRGSLKAPDSRSLTGRRAPSQTSGSIRLKF